MKRIVFTAFSLDNQRQCELMRAAHLDKILEQRGLYYRHRFHADDPLLDTLRAILQKEGIPWIERTEHIFSAVELRTFPLLWISLERASRNTGGPQHGTEYDLSVGCPRCGTGARQVSPLFVRPSVLPKRAPICQTMDFEYLVSADIAAALRGARVAGLELRQVASNAKGPRPRWWQLIAKEAMPRMTPETSGIVRENPCPQCDRDGYFHSNSVPVEIAYRRNDIDPDLLPDVVNTWECFGNSAIKDPPSMSHFAAPLLLVKPRVFDLFRKLRVKGTFFEPVRFLT